MVSKIQFQLLIRANFVNNEIHCVELDLSVAALGDTDLVDDDESSEDEE